LPTYEFHFVTDFCIGSWDWTLRIDYSSFIVAVVFVPWSWSSSSSLAIWRIAIAIMVLTDDIDDGNDGGDGDGDDSDDCDGPCSGYVDSRQQ